MDIVTKVTRHTFNLENLSGSSECNVTGQLDGFRQDILLVTRGRDKRSPYLEAERLKRLSDSSRSQ